MSLIGIPDVVVGLRHAPLFSMPATLEVLLAHCNLRISSSLVPACNLAQSLFTCRCCMFCRLVTAHLCSASSSMPSRPPARLRALQLTTIAQGVKQVLLFFTYNNTPAHVNNVLMSTHLLGILMLCDMCRHMHACRHAGRQAGMQACRHTCIYMNT